MEETYHVNEEFAMSRRNHMSSIPDPIDQRKYASDGIKNKHANWKAQSCDKIEDNAP
ncbi:unnamed protein product [marine sediment metagenome]|uniref:Uncharacterized protein n=1 Tax=marine sediment metagenome TaxID=412755 RepID=X1RF04_9ZZZZ